MNELQKKKLLDEYKEQKDKWSFIAAIITNCTAALAKVFSGSKRKIELVEPDDFISKEFKKIIDQALGDQKQNKNINKKFDKYIQDAKQKGLKVPTKAGEKV